MKLADLATRPPEAGRMRFGIKTPTRNGKMRPEAIDRWRFTSPERRLIEAIADLYGGTPQPWNEPLASPRDQWDVTTSTGQIAVWLPPGSLSQQYELWGGKGCERRCDGEACFTTKPNPHWTDCLCEQEDGKRKCTTKNRLSVLIPGIPYSGVWRMETGSENFTYEAPGQIALIEMLQEKQGLTKVNLILERRQSKDHAGMTRNYVVPKLTLDATPEQMLHGGASVRADLELGPGWEAPKAEQLDPVWHQVAISPAQPEDDDIEDAEIIEEEGWDEIPRGIAVRRNPDPDGPTWIRKRV